MTWTMVLKGIQPRDLVAQNVSLSFFICRLISHLIRHVDQNVFFEELPALNCRSLRFVGCCFIAQFPNGRAVLWWDVKRHSKSPLFCPLCVSEATVSYHLEGPHPSVTLTSLWWVSPLSFSHVIFFFFQYCFSFYSLTFLFIFEL